MIIPYGKQDISEADIQAVVEVLRSDFLTQGPAVPAFEQSVITYTGVKFAVAVNSATSALHIACLALNLGKGDIVWTSPISFVASANCALYCGATVDFVDINLHTYNMCVESLAKKLAVAEKIGNLPKIVIPVHLAGQSCDMQSIYALSQQYGFKIIEDASHAIGGKYLNSPVGNCKYSDITVFSFHPVKIITTGEGGMAVTNDAGLANQLRLLRSHGITRDEAQMDNEPHGAWYYEQIGLGFNYRMTDIQAALGLSQMQRLDEFVEKRHTVAKHYDESLAILHVVTPQQTPDTYSALHLYIIRLNLDQITQSHYQVFNDLREQGILVNLHYIPIYKHPYYQKLGFDYKLCANAEIYYDTAVSIPMYFGLSDSQQNQVTSSLKSALLVNKMIRN